VVGRIYKNRIIYVFDDKLDASGNIWAQVGKNVWCAKLYNGIEYLRVL
jgi:hypothetical protein